MHRVAIGKRAGARRPPDRLEQISDRRGRFRHCIVEPVVGEIRITEQPRALGAQPRHVGDDGFVVGRAAIIATHHESTEHLFAQIAAAGEL